MSLDTQITLSPEAQRILSRLDNFSVEGGRAIARTVDRENELTIGVIQADYLTGPRPTRLGVRSGRLRRSIRRVPTKVTGLNVTSAIGTNVEYAGIHEYGYQGPVQVRAHTRTIDQAFGLPLESPVTVNVRSHTRQVDVPKRAFLRPAIEERIPEYAAAISRTIVRELSGN